MVRVKGLTGATLPRLAPFGVYRCADGWFALVAPQDKLAATLFSVMGRPELIEDSRFATRDARVHHDGALTEEIERWSGVRSSVEVVAVLQRAGVPAAPVRPPQEAIQDERVAAREETMAVEHPVFGAVDDLRTAGIPLRFSGAVVGFDRLAPHLGEHTAEVLSGLGGYSAEYRQQLRDQGVV